MTERDALDETQVIRIDEVDDTLPVPVPQAGAQQALAGSHRRVREGELYYLADEAAPQGWSIVEVASSDSGVLAAFALGQIEAIPLSEVEERILGPVPRPARTTRPRFAA